MGRGKEVDMFRGYGEVMMMSFCFRDTSHARMMIFRIQI
jgi:hypothetical protein